MLEWIDNKLVSTVINPLSHGICIKNYTKNCVLFFCHRFESIYVLIDCFSLNFKHVQGFQTRAVTMSFGYLRVLDTPGIPISLGVSVK